MCSRSGLNMEHRLTLVKLKQKKTTTSHGLTLLLLIQINEQRQFYLYRVTSNHFKYFYQLMFCNSKALDISEPLISNMSVWLWRLQVNNCTKRCNGLFTFYSQKYKVVCQVHHFVQNCTDSSKLSQTTENLAFKKC